MLDFKFHLNVDTAFKEVPIEVLLQKTPEDFVVLEIINMPVS